MMPHRVWTWVESILLSLALCAWLGAADDSKPEDKDSGQSPVSVEGPVLGMLPSGDNESAASPEQPKDEAEKADAKKGQETSSVEKGVEKSAASKDESKTGAESQSSAEKSPAKAESQASSEPPPKRMLSPALTALRDRVRRVLTFYRGQLLSTQENTPCEVMNACLPFGCDTEVVHNGNRLNALTGLCWNYPCAGFAPLTVIDGHVAARVGFGWQERPGQLLAVLAMSRVPEDYSLKAGENVRTVADLVESEKRSCRADADQSLRLVGLSFYCGDETWKNDLDEEWSVQQICEEEILKPIVNAPDGGTTRLLGLTFARNRRLRRGDPLDGAYQRVDKLLSEFETYALQLQNSDGSWSPYFFAARGTSRDASQALRSTGRILEWLATSLDEAKLEEPRVVRSVEFVSTQLASSGYQNSLRAISLSNLSTVMHALRALSLYDERCFKPADDVAPEKPAAESAKTASTK